MPYNSKMLDILKDKTAHYSNHVIASYLVNLPNSQVFRMMLGHDVGPELELVRLCLA